MNPITTATIPLNPDPAIILVQREPGGSITYAAFQTTPELAIDMLRRALVHIVAGVNGLATVPTHAAITANGHTPDPSHSSHSSHSSHPSDPSPIPPLRVPKTQPAAAADPTRNKPGPKPGARRRKIDVEDDE